MIGRRGLRTARHRVVYATLTTGGTLRGILVGDYPDVLVLEQAAHVESSSEMAGRVYVPRTQLQWLQDPGPPVIAAPASEGGA